MAFLPFRLSVPHNGDPQLPGRMLASDWAANVAEIYFAGNPRVLSSGRRPKIRHYITAERTFDAERYDGDFRGMVRELSARGIRPNLLLNAQMVLSSAQIAYIDAMVGEGVGVVTAGTTELVDQVHALWPRLAIQNSVYIDVPSLDDVARLLDRGVTVFLVPPDWNHDLDRIARVQEILLAHGAELKLMINEGCIKRCAHRPDDLRDAQSYPVEAAIEDFLRDPVEIRNPGSACRGYLGRTGIARTNYVHPCDIGRYLGFDPILKIVGRSFTTDVILDTCRSYLLGAYDGDLRYLVENFKHAREPVAHAPNGKAIFY